LENNTDKIVEVFSGTVWECEMVKSLLTNEDINCFFRNYLGTSYGFNPMIAESVKVMVSESDSNRAKEIVAEYLR
jgi:hypothetical protein